MSKLLLVVALVAAAACGGKLPETRYYQLAMTGAPAPPSASAPGTPLTLVLEPLATDAAYDDERIVYRTTPYRLDYYQYHRWSASPGTLIGNYLERALERSGRFHAVIREQTADALVVLGGRVVAIEEVDTSRTSWLGRIVLELTLTDARTGEALWTEQFEETEPLVAQTPEGLARAISAAMARIATKVAPQVSAVASAQSREDPRHAVGKLEPSAAPAR